MRNRGVKRLWEMPLPQNGAQGGNTGCYKGTCQWHPLPLSSWAILSPLSPLPLCLHLSSPSPPLPLFPLSTSLSLLTVSFWLLSSSLSSSGALSGPLLISCFLRVNTVTKGGLVKEYVSRSGSACSCTGTDFVESPLEALSFCSFHLPSQLPITQLKSPSH